MTSAAKKALVIYESGMHSAELPKGFAAWIVDNVQIYEAFEIESLSVAQRREHYSARTIAEFIRHHTLLKEAGDGWKIDNDMVPGLARLFAILNPKHKGLFEFRERHAEGAAA